MEMEVEAVGISEVWNLFMRKPHRDDLEILPFIHIRLLVQQLTKRYFAIDGDRTEKKVNVLYI